jgi:hypothetical protein
MGTPVCDAISHARWWLVVKPHNPRLSFPVMRKQHFGDVQPEIESAGTALRGDVALRLR